MGRAHQHLEANFLAAGLDLGPGSDGNLGPAIELAHAYHLAAIFIGSGGGEHARRNRLLHFSDSGGALYMARGLDHGRHFFHVAA